MLLVFISIISINIFICSYKYIFYSRAFHFKVINNFLRENSIRADMK